MFQDDIVHEVIGLLKFTSEVNKSIIRHIRKLYLNFFHYKLINLDFSDSH